MSTVTTLCKYCGTMIYFDNSYRSPPTSKGKRKCIPLTLDTGFPHDCYYMNLNLKMNESAQRTTIKL